MILVPTRASFFHYRSVFIVSFRNNVYSVDCISTVNIGDTIKIISMKDEPQYTNRTGTITHIDDAGQIHRTW